MDDTPTEPPHLLEAALQIWNLEVGQRHAVSGTGTARMQTQLRASHRVRLPALTFSGGTVL